MLQIPPGIRSRTILGSVAASRYGHSIDARIATIPTAGRGAVRSSLAAALDQAKSLGLPEASAVASTARHAFVDGVHFAVTVGAVSAAVGALVVLRFLPHEATHESAHEAAEHMAELGVAGTLPTSARDAGHFQIHSPSGRVSP